VSGPVTDARFPLPALLGAGGMIAATFLLAGYVRLSGADISSLPPPRLVVSRELRFADLPDGGVAVYDAQRAAQPIRVLPPGSNGFVRATMRNLVHERRSNGIGPAAPFRLAASADGRLILEDPATGRRIELEAFGPTNAGAFAVFLGDAHD
jgi:putative photosynthetic complex assembly protein